MEATEKSAVKELQDHAVKQLIGSTGPFIDSSMTGPSIGSSMKDILQEEFDEENRARSEERQPTLTDEEKNKIIVTKAIEAVIITVSFCDEQRRSIGLPTNSPANRQEEISSGIYKLAPAAGPKQKRKELKRVEKKIEELKDALTRLNWATKSKLQENSKLVALSILEHKLENITSAVRKTIKETPNPRGGREPPKMPVWFVRWCAVIFEAWQPEKVSSTPHGPFSTFVLTIHELVTGEREANFERHIKTALKIHREDKFLSFSEDWS